MSEHLLPCGCAYDGETGEITRRCPIEGAGLKRGTYQLQVDRHAVVLEIIRINGKMARAVLEGMEIISPVGALAAYIAENPPRARNDKENGR